MAKRQKNQVGRPSSEQPFDNVLKSLFEGQEEQVLPVFLPGAEFLETLNVEALRPPLRVDRTYKIKQRNKPKIMHIELETGSNSEMAYRLLDYHTYFLRKFKGLPVISIIIYPFRTHTVESPFLEMDDDEELLKFNFRVFCLWKMEARRFIIDHIISLYALLPTMQGADEALLNQAIEELAEYYKNDETKLARQLRWLGILLRRADVVPPDDKRRVQERLNMWNDLMEKDPKMREIREKSKAQGLAKGKAEGLAKGKAEGLVEGKAEGLAEGLAEGQVKGLQQAVVGIVRGRFPELSELAQQKVTEVNEAPVLNYLVEKLATAPDEAMVRWLLRPSAA